MPKPLVQSTGRRKQAVARVRLGARAEGRSDDADPDAIERRLQLFHEETVPLLSHYENRGILITIDATQPPDAVLATILRALNSLADGSP